MKITHKNFCRGKRNSRLNISSVLSKTYKLLQRAQAHTLKKSICIISSPLILAFKNQISGEIEIQRKLKKGVDLDLHGLLGVHIHGENRSDICNI